MKITPIKKFQMGGQIAPEAPVEEAPMNAPAEQAPLGGEDPMMMLFLMAALALQGQDCQAAMQVCQALLEIGQQMQGGAPEEAPGEPVFAKNGCKVVRRIKKNTFGTKFKKK